MSKESKVVFAAFMQHCIQSTDLMSKGSKVYSVYRAPACNVARLYEIFHVEGVERNKNRHNRLDLRHLFLMSKESKVHLIYIVDFNTKYSNYMKI